MTDGASHASLKSRHEQEERALVRAALVDCGWGLGTAADRLGLGLSALQKMIDRLGLREEYSRHNPGRGRRKSPRVDE